MADIPNVRYAMELEWHSCTNNLPRETYHPTLYVTNGREVFPTAWKCEPEWKRFEIPGWYIEPGVNSDGWWWADLVQTVNGFEPVQPK